MSERLKSKRVNESNAIQMTGCHFGMGKTTIGKKYLRNMSLIVICIESCFVY